MGYRVYLIIILDGGTNSNSTRPFPDRPFLQQTTFFDLIDLLLTVIRHINERRFKLHQWIHVIKQVPDIISFQRWKNFNGKQCFPIGTLNMIANFHFVVLMC